MQGGQTFVHTQQTPRDAARQQGRRLLRDFAVDVELVRLKGALAHQRIAQRRKVQVRGAGPLQQGFQVGGQRVFHVQQFFVGQAFVVTELPENFAAILIHSGLNLPVLYVKARH